MWDTYNEDRTPGIDIGRILWIVFITAFSVIILAIASNQSVKLLMNLTEFGTVFTKPLYYSLLSGLLLGAIAVVRINIRARHSMTWYGISLIIIFLKRSRLEYKSPSSRYSEFKMSKKTFALWQLTKMILFAPIFSNIIFGMTLEYVAHGNEIGLGSIGRIFLLPFTEIPMDGSYARQNVIPMLPGLTLLVPPVLNAVGTHLFLYVGISGFVNIASSYSRDRREAKPKFQSYISEIEVIAGVAIFWMGFNMFFSSVFDYNTRYVLSIMIALGATLIGYGFLDRRRARVIIYPTRKAAYLRLGTAVIAAAVAGSIIAVNNSIADTNKVEWYGPHIAQELAVNRYIHGLDQIETLDYNIKNPSTSPSIIQSTLGQNSSSILNNVRLWDETNAKSKLSQELGAGNDMSYADAHIVRFGQTNYWAATASPNVPQAMTPRDRWFNEHMVYTHSDAGVKMLEATNGNLIDKTQFFKQYQIYYGESGESGTFSRFWSAFPADRKQNFEFGGDFYNGTGGVDIPPPLSWMFDPNFILYDAADTMHIMRYKDIHDRMQFLYPYFAYEFSFDGTPNNPQFKKMEAFPVTDGKNTYWLMPLVVALDSSRVPWSSPTPFSFMLSLVGFGLIDAYNGNVHVFVTGNDYFSEIFLEEYKDTGATREVPEWLQNQLTYPKEMLMWKISKFNIYHVTDPKSFLESKAVYTVAADPTNQELSPYYVIAQPPGFKRSEFIGLQYLQLRDSPSKDLVGYMIVHNEFQSLGKMTFYSIASNSSVKLIGPETARTTFMSHGEYNKLNQDLKSRGNATTAVVAGNLLYKIGDYEVYFIPVMINSGEKIGFVGAVGAISTNSTSTYIGLGNTAKEAFVNYLQKLPVAIAENASVKTSNHSANETLSRIQQLERVFNETGLTVVKPTAINGPLAFMEEHANYTTESNFAQAEAAIKEFAERFTLHHGRVFEWQGLSSINFGVLLEVDGIIENHYISIEVDNRIGNASS